MRFKCVDKIVFKIVFNLPAEFFYSHMHLAVIILIEYYLNKVFIQIDRKA